MVKEKTRLTDLTYHAKEESWRRQRSWQKHSNNEFEFRKYSSQATNTTCSKHTRLGDLKTYYKIQPEDCFPADPTSNLEPSYTRIEARGSCNGMICLSQNDGYLITSLAVMHPLRKEYYELPLFPLHFEKHMRRESCGLGFDAFTKTWKMVCVLLKAYTPPDKPDMVKKNLCTMLHVFGTNGWREIPQVSSYPVT
nr:hypothetical protein [Tanacetum cinerariifolium]